MKDAERIEDNGASTLKINTKKNITTLAIADDKHFIRTTHHQLDA
jgi:hypothetical protein